MDWGGWRGNGLTYQEMQREWFNILGNYNPCRADGYRIKSTEKEWLKLQEKLEESLQGAIVHIRIRRRHQNNNVKFVKWKYFQ